MVIVLSVLTNRVHLAQFTQSLWGNLFVSKRKNALLKLRQLLVKVNRIVWKEVPFSGIFGGRNYPQSLPHNLHMQRGKSVMWCMKEVIKGHIMEEATL